MKRPRFLKVALVAAGAACLAGTLYLTRELVLADTPGKRPVYLQDERTDGVTLCWTSEAPEPSLAAVRSPGGTPRAAGSTAPVLRHEVRLAGLAPGRRYEYQLSGERGWRSFRTAPAGPAAFRFAVMGDIGEASRGEAEVAELLENHRPDFAVALGDLAYPSGRERTLTQRFFAPLAPYAGSHVIWHVFGNHDVAGDHGRPLDLASATPGNGPRDLPRNRNYSFDYGDAHFAVVDTNLPRPTLQRVVAPWLKRDLAGTQRRWKFVMMHHPAYSTGPHGDSRKVRSVLEPVIRRAKVNAVFAGHDHNYQRFKPIGGVTYVVSGEGGASLYRFESSRESIAARDDRHHGLTLVDVSAAGARLRHLSGDGTVLDEYTLPVDGG